MRRSPVYFFVFLALILPSLDALAQLAERKVDIYGIYTTAREQSIDLANEWMDQHLKGAM